MERVVYRLGGVVLVIAAIGEGLMTSPAVLLTPLGQTGVVLGSCFVICEVFGIARSGKRPSKAETDDGGSSSSA